ncbi:MAG: single-stranded DNA-binding protein [Lactobacillales bacterium]|nr:single-stranded DNA-binding protein [Lactobacillales bacterium]
MNQVIMTGRLAKNIEKRTLENGNIVAKTSIAVKRDYVNKNGERDTDFFFITLFGKRAEIFSQYMSKGSLIFISGILRNNSYEKDGQRKYQNELIVQNFEFLESKSKNTKRKTKNNELTNLEEFQQPIMQRTDNQMTLDENNLPL